MKKFKSFIAFMSMVVIFAFQSPVNAADLYANYQALAAENVEGVDYRITSRKTSSSTAVIAIHGGGIEPGTTEIADNIAGSTYSYYSFMGIKSSNNSSLHITSTKFDEPIALSLVKNSKRTLSIHGFASSTKLTYIGGLDKTLVNNVKKSLTEAGFKVADAPSHLAGNSTSNICNKNSSRAGVQIELSTALRASFFASLTSSGRKTKTADFYNYTSALKKALSSNVSAPQTDITNNTTSDKTTTPVNSTTNNTTTNKTTTVNTKTSGSTSVVKSSSNSTSPVKQTKSTASTDLVDGKSDEILSGEQINASDLAIATYMPQNNLNVGFNADSTQFYKYTSVLYLIMMMLAWSPEFIHLFMARKEFSYNK